MRWNIAGLIDAILLLYIGKDRFAMYFDVNYSIYILPAIKILL